jgi:hypothetical protein
MPLKKREISVCTLARSKMNSCNTQLLNKIVSFYLPFQVCLKLSSLSFLYYYIILMSCLLICHTFFHH